MVRTKICTHDGPATKSKQLRVPVNVADGMEYEASKGMEGRLGGWDGMEWTLHTAHSPIRMPHSPERKLLRSKPVSAHHSETTDTMVREQPVFLKARNNYGPRSR